MAQVISSEIALKWYYEAKADSVWAWYGARVATSKAKSEALSVTADTAQKKAAQIKGTH